MLNNVFKILPFFIVQWVAQRKCERITLSHGQVYVTAFKNTLILCKRWE